MSFAARPLARTATGSLRTQVRFSSSTPPPLQANLLLSRSPLLTPTPTPLETSYHAHSRSIAHALSNPLPTDFYFKTGSLPLKRHLVREHQYETEIYGEKLAGKAPDVGEIPAETDYEEIARNHWEQADAQRGDKSLERKPEEEVFCVVKTKEGGKWTFPGVEAGRLEPMHEAVERGITGVEGSLGGQGMDSWLVTRKPVGLVKDGESRTFFLRGHILAGEPTLSPSSPYTAHAWLTAEEVEERLKKQGDDKIWESVKGMFGVSKE
ncbi:hypothetical protein B9479_005644 [Cryptococcus floricola]|uniref:Large ribosomal subunit protein mL46 n=1 Tax=Cryptococcus floricola TaxID=2591691 RepID=A0A5D3AV99_9TREE|nr:hypothetical protein B9479_005644 [Cryptococcus floricola]